MTYKRSAALVIALLLIGVPNAMAVGISGTDVAGTVPRLLTAISDKNAQCVECTLGDAVADAMRIYLKTDIAIVNGGDLVGNLPAGEITWDGLKSVFAEDRTLATVNVSIRQLREILEAGLSHIKLDASEKVDVEASVYAGFPQISGFALYYDTSAPPGERVRDIIIDEKSLDLGDTSKTVTLAATAFMLDGGYGSPKTNAATPSGLTLSGVTARYMNGGMADYQTTGTRIRPMGTIDGIISGPLITGIIVVAIAISMLGRVWKLKRLNNTEL